MKDRIPLYPGRVKLTPVSGQGDIYDMARADNPTQEGTPLNKNSLLKDTTAALFGLGANAVPDDVLALLSRLHSGLGNEYVWEKVIEGTFYKENRSSPNIITIYNSNAGTCGKTIKISQTDGSVTITDVIAAQPFVTGYGSYWSAKIPFYCQYGSTLYYVDGVMENEGSAGIRFSQVRTVTITSEEGFESFGYVNSPAPNAYPPAVDDGYTYTALGMLGEKARFATGSYTGTGTWGSSTPNSITFSFAPKLVILLASKTRVIDQFAMQFGTRCDSGGNYSTVIPTHLLTTSYAHGLGFANGSNYERYAKKSSDGKTVYWYETRGNGVYQYNSSETEYYYIAIG